MSINTKIATTLLEKCQKDRENQTLCDYTVTVEGVNYPVHKIVLMASCDYFETLFTSNFDHKEKEQLELKTVTKKPFEFLLNYMYGQPLILDNCEIEDIVESYQLADMLILESFKIECHQFVDQWKENVEANLDKCYALAKNLQIDAAILDMKSTICEIISRQSDYELSVDSYFKFEKIPLELLLATIPMVKFDLIFFKRISNWLLRQPRPFLDLHANSVFENVFLLEHLFMRDINQFFKEHQQNKTFPNSQISRLQLVVHETLEKHYENNVPDDEFHKLQLLAVLYKGSTLNFSRFDWNANTWSRIASFAEAPFEIGYGRIKYFVDKNRLFVFDETFAAWKTRPCQFQIFDLEETSARNDILELPHLENQFYNFFAAGSKLHILSFNRSQRFELIIYDMGPQTTNIHHLPECHYSPSLTSQKNTVYYSSDNKIFKFDPYCIGGSIETSQLIYTFPENTYTFKMLVTPSDELIIANRYSVLYMKDDVIKIVNHNWLMTFIHLTEKSLFVLKGVENSNEMKISCYGYEELQKDITKERFITITKPNLTIPQFFLH